MKKTILLMIATCWVQFCMAQVVNIPDANFKAALIALGVDKNANNLIEQSEALLVTSLDVTLKNINDLTGIASFTNLTFLDCRENNISFLNVSHNVSLTYLNCVSNQLSTLDVSKNTALTHLSCGDNHLTTINVSTNIALTFFTCDHNNLSSLDVSKNTALTMLTLELNQITALDVSHNTALQQLACFSNQLTTLNVTQNTALNLLMCNSNHLTALDLSRNINLNTLDCSSNQLAWLNVSVNTALTSLNCNSNQLTVLNVSKNTSLTSLDCAANQLSALDISRNTALVQVNCFGNPNLPQICINAAQVSKTSSWTKDFAAVWSSSCPVYGANFQNPIALGALTNAGSAPLISTENNSPANNFKNDYGAASDDIFYTFTLTAPAVILIDHCASTISDSKVYLFSATQHLLASNDDNGPQCTGLKASLWANLAAGTYYIVSEGYGTNTGDITTRVRAFSCQNAAGSTMAAAIPISLVSGCFVSTQSNVGCNYNLIPLNSSPEVYYMLNLSSTTTVNISTCNSEMADTYMYLLNQDGTVNTSNDDNGPLCGASVNGIGSTRASLIKTLAAGTYYVAVEGYNTGTGYITLNVWAGSNVNACSSSGVVAARIGEMSDGEKDLTPSEPSSIALTDVIVYPNPTNGKAYLKIPQLNETTTVIVSDVYGKEVYKVQTSNIDTEINTMEFADGIYYVTFQMAGKTVSKKLQVVK